MNPARGQISPPFSPIAPRKACGNPLFRPPRPAESPLISIRHPCPQKATQTKGFGVGKYPAERGRDLKVPRRKGGDLKVPRRKGGDSKLLIPRWKGPNEKVEYDDVLHTLWRVTPGRIFFFIISSSAFDARGQHRYLFVFVNN